MLLPIISLTANGESMRAKFTSLFVLLAMLFGSIVVPASAQSKDATAPHSGEMFAALEHADNADHRDDHQDKGEEPCQAVTHHHCSIALAVDGPLLTLSTALTDMDVSRLMAAAMSSLSQAPPTEPPAA